MTCVSAAITSCSGVDPLNFTYGQIIPSGTVKGVIVYFDGGDDTTAVVEGPEEDMLQYYFDQNYAVVEIQWSSAWEETSAANIQNAACRPATFLNYVYQNIYVPIANNVNNLNPGMCAQGYSAGSASIAYALAYYGAGGYLDAVELISGPVLSDLKQGCEQNPQPVTVCPAGQYGCQLGTDQPWTLPPSYVGKDVHYINSWTGSNTCTTGSNPSWLAESIVDQNAGLTPTFTYPTTAMSGWLCRSVQNPNPNCATNYNYDNCPNNSSTQGEIYYQNFTSSNHPPIYKVYSVDNCFNPEGAPQGSVSALSTAQIIAPGAQSIQNDMVLNCTHP